MESLKKNESAKTQRRYQRISRIYDFMEIIPEKKFHPWRKDLWKKIEGPKVLEIGVGTGKNIEFYPEGLDITAIDLTPGMLEIAKRKAHELGKYVDLKLGDAENLNFPDNSFNSIVSTFVFCSVPDPVKGLKEIKRVLKKGGRMYIIEHVRSERKLLGKIMDILNPIVVRLMGPNINRKTVKNVHLAGFSKINAYNLDSSGIFKLIIANK